MNQYIRIASSLIVGGLLLAGLLLGLSVALPTIYADSGAYFVTPGGTGAGTQSAPCDLVTALGLATDGDTLYLAGGTYTGTGDEVVRVTHSITLYGGWDGAPAGPVARDPATHVTILDGQSQRRGVYVNSGITVTLEGFTVTNGVVIGNGGGLYARDAFLTLRGMTFHSNVVTASNYAYGGGAFVEGGMLYVEAATFRGNSAWATKSCYGGGLAISHTFTATVTSSMFWENDAWFAGGLSFRGEVGGHLFLSNSTFVDNGLGHSSGQASGGYAAALEVANAQARIEGNTFQGNRASNDYGTVAIFGSDLTLARNIILGNQCARTSGLYLSSVSPFTATNNIIAQNRSTHTWLQSPAVRVHGGSGQFLHNTIACNESTYGLELDSGATVALTNTILVSHTLGISVTAGNTAVLEGTLWGGGSWANDTDWGGDGNIFTGTVNVWGAPAFVDPDGGDYHIGSGSAAIDAGVDAEVADDIDGDMRPIGSGYDIGADEHRAVYLPLILRN